MSSKETSAAQADEPPIRPHGDPNLAGLGAHIPSYASPLLEDIESQRLKPRSPYYATNQGDYDDFFTSGDPTLPPHTGESLHYEELPKGNWIRILKLEPGYVFNKVLKCSLIPINLDEQHEPYEALSYTWGSYYDDPELQAKATQALRRVRNNIVCNGVWKGVTSSLAHALLHFRKDDRPRYLWADALCINQNDEAEKDVQIALMQRIYQSAKEVLIWVGWYSDDEVETAMNVLCYLANQECGIEQEHGVKAIWFDDGTPVEIPRISARPSSASSWYEEDHPADTATVPFVPTSLAPLVPLFEACYFRRLWVFQEVALSPLAAMFWGRARIRFEWVALVAEKISDHHMAEFAAYDTALAGLQMCAKMHYAWRGAYKEKSFFDLLIDTRDLKATQAQDKVWGLLGIETRDSDPKKEVFLEPKVGMKPVEVFENIARKVITEKKDLRCLAAVEHGEYEQEDYSMDGRASWVPNFGRKQATFLPILDFRAHGDVPTQIPNSHCPGSLCLTLKGLIVDPITSVIDCSIPWKSHWRSFERLKKLQELVSQLLSFEDEVKLALCLTAGFATDMQSRVTDTAAHGLALRTFQRWHDPGRTQNGAIMPPSGDTSEEIEMAYKFFQASAKAMYKRCVFRTKGGLLAAGPENARVGDVVAILFGANVPFVLAPDGDHYRLIGQSYVNELMEGQAVHAWQRSDKAAEDIHIV